MTLNKIYWSFNKTFYNSVEEFSKDVSKHQIMIKENDEAWIPSEIIIESPILQIQYMAWVKSEDLLENESLIEEDAEAFDDEPDDDDGMYQVEILAKFKADNGKNFTADEFLMKAHNAQVNKELGDHVFFEGLDNEPTIIDGIPTYYIACGS